MSIRRPTNANRRVSGQAWSPLKVANLRLWLDFGDPSTLTIDESEITDIQNKADGSTASKTGTGPTLTYDRNGRSYANFPTGIQELQGNWSIEADANLTAFVVLRTASTAGPEVILTSSDQLTTGGDGFNILNASTEYQIRSDDSPSFPTASAPRAHQDFRLLRGQIDGTSSMSAALDGYVTDTNTPSSRVAMTDYRLGRYVGASGFTYTGDIAEVLVFDRLLSDAEIAAIETYLKAKWAIDWKAFDWSQFGSAIAAYHAVYPENTGAASGAEIVTLPDYVGSNDAAAIFGNADASFDWTASKPAITIPANQMIGADLPAGFGEGTSAYCITFAGATTVAAEATIFSITSSSSNTSYVSVFIGSNGEIRVMRSIDATNSYLDTGLFVVPYQPTVITIGYDGSSFWVRVNDSDEVELVAATSLPSIDRFSIGGVNRLTPVAPYECIFREAVFFDECPSESDRAAIHAAMISRNPILGRLEPSFDEDFDSLASVEANGGTVTGTVAFEGSASIASENAGLVQYNGKTTLLSGWQRATLRFRLTSPTNISGASYILAKNNGGGTLPIQIAISGSFLYIYFTASNYARVSVSANTEYTVSMVYDGGGATNADRLKVYLGGVAQTAGFAGTIPTSIGADAIAPTVFGYLNVADAHEPLAIDYVKVYPVAMTAGEVAALDS